MSYDPNIATFKLFILGLEALKVVSNSNLKVWLPKVASLGVNLPQ